MESVLHTPFLTPEAASAAAQIRLHRLPAWLIGEANSGLALVARAIHQADDAAELVTIRLRLTDPEDLDRLLRRQTRVDTPPSRLILYIERIDRQPLTIQEEVLRQVEDGFLLDSGERVTVRLLAHSERLPAPGEVRLLAPLRSFLEPFVLRLQSIAERPDDAIAIARIFAVLAAHELELDGAAHRPDGLERVVESRSWRSFDELRTTVRRLVVEALGPPSSEPVRADDGPSGDIVDRDPTRWLEFVTTELAHELKNPMVTIKTFIQQLDTVLADPALRERFVHLTRDAVDRMDGFMEELLEFSRFGPPRRRPVSLAQILAEASAETFTGRVKLPGIPHDQRVLVDEDQLVLAFRVLFRGILGKLPQGAEIVVRWRPRGEIRLTSPGEIGLSRKLQSMLRDDHGRAAALPLRVILGRVLIERNDGVLEIEPGQSSSEVSVVLPPAP